MTRSDHRQSGFTLVEALVAIVVLVFGLIAVTNLFLVGASSNQAANHSTAATAEATEVLETLKEIPFTLITTGGDLDNDVGAGAPQPCQPDCIGTPDDCPSVCVIPGNFNYYRDVPGVGMIRTRWTIADPGLPGAPTLFFTVRSESIAPLVGGMRSRAEFTTFRTCTSASCPP